MKEEYIEKQAKELSECLDIMPKTISELQRKAYNIALDMAYLMSEAPRADVSKMKIANKLYDYVEEDIRRAKEQHTEEMKSYYVNKTEQVDIEDAKRMIADAYILGREDQIEGDIRSLKSPEEVLNEVINKVFSQLDTGKESKGGENIYPVEKEIADLEGELKGAEALVSTIKSNLEIKRGNKVNLPNSNEDWEEKIIGMKLLQASINKKSLFGVEFTDAAKVVIDFITSIREESRKDVNRIFELMELLSDESKPIEELRKEMQDIISKYS